MIYTLQNIPSAKAALLEGPGRARAPHGREEIEAPSWLKIRRELETSGERNKAEHRDGYRRSDYQPMPSK